jgi:hypothetical protein
MNCQKAMPTEHPLAQVNKKMKKNEKEEENCQKAMPTEHPLAQVNKKIKKMKK